MSAHQARFATRPIGSVFVPAFSLVLALLPAGCEQKTVSGPTVADLQPVHAGVSLGEVPVRRLRRVPENGVVETVADGRARVRLDDGTVIVLDGNTRITVGAGRAKIERGRVFVTGAEGARTQIAVGEATVVVSGSNAAVRLAPENANNASVYAASGEIAVRAGGKDVAVQTGESAAIVGADVKVAPERAFDDWTGGLASPWGAAGKPSRAVGELWGRDASSSTDVGSPLTIRSQAVESRMVGESAETVVKTAFFHAGDGAVVGDFRMALPPGAIVSGFAVGIGADPAEASIGLASREDSEDMSPRAMLEWAGDGWVRGIVPGISPGSVVTVVLRYVEWLHPEPKGSSVTLAYRFPLAGEAAPPIVGEFAARIDASLLKPTAVWPGQGAAVSNGTVELRRSDFKPTADLVSEFETQPFRSPARLYMTPAGPNDDAGDYVLVRAEAPSIEADQGVSLVIVLDLSASTDGGMLDSQRAFVEALLGLLGPRDNLLVLQADETARPVGPAALGAVDEARRKAIQQALSTLSPGGATDLGRAIEAGADAFATENPTAMVVYVGDGWPTVGDFRVNEIRARLARRTRPMPRVGAVAVGPAANRFGLTALVRGSGPLLEVGDRVEAASNAASLVADALHPMVAGVELQLGKDVEQVYPLEPRSVRSGDTLWAVGRLRGTAPRQVTLAWRDAKGPQSKVVALSRESSVNDQDVSRRWAAARAEELALRGSGREAVTDVALRTQLLTPWTAWVTGLSEGKQYVPSRLDTRVLDLSCGADAVFSASLSTVAAPGASLLDLGAVADDPQGNDAEAMKAAIRAAAGRVIDDAGSSVRACRDSRAALRPDLSGTLEVKFKVDGDGTAKDIKVSGPPSARDDALFRCVVQVVAGLSFPATGIAGTVEIVQPIMLPPGRSPARTKCSATSQLPVPLRRGVWAQRFKYKTPVEVYSEARRSCELQSWAAKRSLLELSLLRVVGVARVNLARDLDLLGEADAATFLRQEAVKRARAPEEVRQIRKALLRGETYPVKAFEKAYTDAYDGGKRLAVVRRFLGLAPHDVRLRRQLLRLLEAAGNKDTLRQEAALIRRDPHADASLLADCASALRRVGDDAEARRMFGEIVERAPNDPWARAYAADRLRNEGLFDQAGAVVAPLEKQLAGEPGVTLRAALANEGAGRIDVAARMLSRLTQSGGRSERDHFHELASDVATVMLLSPRQGLSPADKAELERRSLELPRPPRGTVVFLRTGAALSQLQAKIVRGPDTSKEEREPDALAPDLGLYRFRLDPDDPAPIVLRLAAAKDLPPAAATHVQVVALVANGSSRPPTLVLIEVDLPANGDEVKLAWRDNRWEKL